LNLIKKIVVIGPESTGKSTLSSQLAEEHNTLWVPEYAREYLLKHGMKYSYDDLLTIARNQIAMEERYEQELMERIESEKGSGATPPVLFVDTNMYVMQVWCEFVFGKCHTWVLEQIAQRKYDMYLLCNPDLPWVKDELREYPDLESRLELYYIYKEIMTDQSVPWHEIKGDYDHRFTSAIQAVKIFF
jgi:NadR type nicotinamide-nucleotide adenylyltransferase